MTITLHNRQRGVRLDLAWLRRFAQTALPLCAEQSADGNYALKRLEEVEVTVVSDRTIARVHRDFMDIPGATDVITFEHGEIVVSADTAQNRAAEFGHGTEEELGLYTVHGLLHLNGFEDATPSDAARMHDVQNGIWKACLDQLPTPARK